MALMYVRYDDETDVEGDPLTPVELWGRMGDVEIIRPSTFQPSETDMEDFLMLSVVGQPSDSTFDGLIDPEIGPPPDEDILQHRRMWLDMDNPNVLNAGRRFSLNAVRTNLVKLRKRRLSRSSARDALNVEQAKPTPDAGEVARLSTELILAQNRLAEVRQQIGNHRFNELQVVTPTKFLTYLVQTRDSLLP